MIEYIDGLINHMNQNVDDDIIDDLRKAYKTHMKIEIHNDIPDDFVTTIIDSYKNEESKYLFTKSNKNIKDRHVIKVEKVKRLNTKDYNADTIIW
jgi:hypothetical protein